MNATIEQLARTAQRITRELADEQATSYAFPDDGAPWVPTLRGLPFSCLLWRRFREADEARRAYEAAQERRDRWRRERVHVLRQAEEMTRDPDTIDLAAYRAAKDKAEVLERALDTLQGTLAELKETWMRTDERWGQLWQGYSMNEQEIMRQQRRQDGGAVGAGDQYHALQPMLAKKRDYEAPQGA